MELSISVWCCGAAAARELTCAAYDGAAPGCNISLVLLITVDW